MFNKNTKKGAFLSSLVALILCCSMFVGTTFAWFTDEVTSGMNTIAAGNLDVELLADGAKVDSTTMLFDDVDLWEPGVVVYENIQVANVGTLALKYQMTLNFRDVNDLNGHKLSEVVKVAVIDKIDGNATRAEVLAEAKANGVSLTNFYLTGELEAGESATEQAIVVYWEPNDNATDNLYNANNGQVTSDGNPLSIEFGINLQATQLMSEKDSFGNDYDEFASILPKAQVIDQGAQTVTATTSFPNGTDVLEYSVPFVLQFQPNETYEEAQSSAYRYWHADYVVKADKDVPADSVALIGYYKAFCDAYNNGNWVAMTNAGTTITAGTEIRLVQLLGATVNYEEICNFGNDGTGFLCTATDLTGENVGTTITVELRLYETTGDPTTTTGSKNEETGNYEVVGTYSYTFGAYEVASAEDLQAALTAGASKVKLADNVVVTSPLTITADTVIDGNGNTLTYTGSNRAIEIANNADYDVDVTIKNLTVDCSASYCERGINYNDNGTLTLDNVTVKGDPTYGINLPGKSVGATVVINGGSYSANIALNVWGENSVVTANNVEFITVDNTDGEGYAAVKLNNAGDVSAEDAVININGGSITITGSYCDDSYAVTNATLTGVINISETTTVTGKIVEGYVSVVKYEGTDNFYSHTSLQNSVKCVEAYNSGWIVLLTDVTVDSLEVNGNVTIDTNDFELTVGSYTGSGILTVDGTVVHGN